MTYAAAELAFYSHPVPGQTGSCHLVMARIWHDTDGTAGAFCVPRAALGPTGCLVPRRCEPYIVAVAALTGISSAGLREKPTVGRSLPLHDRRV